MQTAEFANAQDDKLVFWLTYPWSQIVRCVDLTQHNPLKEETSTATYTTVPETMMTTVNAAPAPQRPAFDLKNAASQAEYETIMNVLKQVNFNKSKAADIHKIDRKTLYNKLRVYESHQHNGE